MGHSYLSTIRIIPAFLITAATFGLTLPAQTAAPVTSLAMSVAVADTVASFRNSASASAAADSISSASVRQLDEVVVTARTPAVKVAAGRIVYNLKRSASGENGTLLDALSSIPGIDIGNSGSISLYGERGATIIIDGKKTYLKGRELINYLNSIPASAAGTISIRNAADARDDVSDKGGFIEIATIRVSKQGFTLGANGSFSAWRNMRGNGSLNLGYNRGRSAFRLLYSFFAARKHIRLDIDRHYITGNRMFQTSTRLRLDNAHTIKGGWRYRPDKYTNLEADMSFSMNSRNEYGNMESRIPAFSEISSSHNRNRSRWRTLMADIFAGRRFGYGNELSIGLNLLHYHTSEGQLLESTTPDTHGSRVSGNVRWLIDQMDYTKTFANTFRLQAGFKNTFVSISNGGHYYNRQDDVWTPNTELSSTFRYLANTNAAYAQVSITRGSLAATAGVRIEHERLRGAFSGDESASDTTYRTNSIEIVPSAELKFSFIGSSALSLSYSRGISRPDYADLNPFVYVFDEYTHAGGNISLHSSVSDNIRIGFSYAGLLQASVFMTYTGDAIMKCYRETTGSRVYVAAENIPGHMQAGMRLILADLSIGRRWDMTAAATALYNRYELDDGGRRVCTCRLTPLLNLDNRFDFGAGWSAEFKAGFTGSMAYGQVTLHPSAKIEASVRRSFLNGKASASFFIRDILATDRTRAIICLGGHISRFEETEYRRMAGISFSYRFNTGRKASAPTERKGSDELDRL